VPTAPDPLAPALLLAAAARLNFRVLVKGLDGQLGELVDGDRVQHLIVTRDGWVASADLPPGFGPFLLPRETFDVLRLGKADGQRGVLYGEATYRVHTWFDSQRWTARAIKT
jgi:hypothetical protein